MTFGYGISLADGFMNGFGYGMGLYRPSMHYPPRPNPYIFHFGYMGNPYRIPPYYDFNCPIPFYSDFMQPPPRPYWGGALYQEYPISPYGGAYGNGYALGALTGAYRYANSGLENYYASRDYANYNYYYNPSRASRINSPYSVSSNRQTGRVNNSQSRTGGRARGRYEYSRLSRADAINRAKMDDRLEYIGNGGTGWSCSSATFANDITYATKGTSALLDAVIAKIRQTDPDFTLLITSALGTATSPHKKNITSSHYNPDNVKLDFGGALNETQANSIAKKLMATGYFEFAHVEYNGGSSGTYHIDAMFKPEMLEKAARGEI